MFTVLTKVHYYTELSFSSSKFFMITWFWFEYAGPMKSLHISVQYLLFLLHDQFPPRQPQLMFFRSSFRVHGWWLKMGIRVSFRIINIQSTGLSTAMCDSIHGIDKIFHYNYLFELVRLQLLLSCRRCTNICYLPQRIHTIMQGIILPLSLFHSWLHCLYGKSQR